LYGLRSQNIPYMSQHKKRKHVQQIHTPHPQKGIIYHKVIPVAVIIFILFGLGISLMIAGVDIKWLVAGGIIGGACGFLFGYQIAKGLSKK
jgi:hypothetical protein